MFVQRVFPVSYKQKHSFVKFRGSESQNPQVNTPVKDDSYYRNRAELYVDMYYQCGGAGCDDEEIVAYYLEQMTEIENEFKAANRRIKDYIPTRQDNDDI